MKFSICQINVSSSFIVFLCTTIFYFKNVVIIYMYYSCFSENYALVV